MKATQEGNTENESSVCKEHNYHLLFTKFSKDIYKYLYYKTGNEVLAKDTVQETFIKLWENCAKVPFEKAKFYLLRVAKNKVIDSYRTQKIKIEFKDTHIKRVNTETPLFLMEKDEYEVTLNNVLNSMPEKFRITFLMNRIDGKKYREIAEELDISVKTVEFRMQKALKHLKKELGTFNR